MSDAIALNDPQPSAAQPDPIGFLDVFYRAIFHPVHLYQRISEDESLEKNRLFLYGLFLVLFISGLNPILFFITNGADEMSKALWFQVPIMSIANVVTMLSYALTGTGRARNFLILSAYSLIPWTLLAPLSLIKQGLGTVGSVFGTLGMFLVALWVLALFALAIGVTYRLTFERVLIVLGVIFPFAFGLGLSVWFLNVGVNILAFFA